MKKLFILVLALMCAGVMCGQENSAKDRVTVNGVTWATCNVDAPGTFADSPESTGMFYQWNRTIGWSATDNITDWNRSSPVGSIWEKVNSPCPQGWRVPTIEELNTLLNTKKVEQEWTTQNGVNGRKFTDKVSGSFLFLPAAGYRDYSDGALLGVGNNGYYWSSVKVSEVRARSLDFGNADASMGSGNRIYGFSVRCVAE